MSARPPTRIAVVGCGFWSQYQISSWRELPEANVVALCDVDPAKAEAVGRRFEINRIYNNADELLNSEHVDLLDVITTPQTHSEMVHVAARHKVPVICQKPLAPSLKVAEEMVRTCAASNLPLLVHENWRWQTPIRALKNVLKAGTIGQVFRARVDFISGFPVFKNQPFLRELKQFILTDLGTHLLDAARFLFGEATTLYCQTRKLHSDIAGEDVATVIAEMSGATVVCNMAYAENFLEHDRFPQTFIFVEGEKGSVELGPDYSIRVTTAEGTDAKRYPPPRYKWADPAYDVVQASIVPCCANLLAAVRGELQAETTGEDNLKTLRMVFGAYESARQNAVVRVDGHE
jgi:predicted dehydrogenase